MSSNYIRLISWAEFKALPEARQRAYIRECRRADMSDTEIARTMGVTRQSLQHYTGKLGLKHFVQRETLCWDCRNACRDCEWSKSFEPVPGWTAEETVISENNVKTKSYHVIACPKYERDSVFRGVRE